jgi:hypothetical protein
VFKALCTIRGGEELPSDQDVPKLKPQEMILDRKTPTQSVLSTPSVPKVAPAPVLNVAPPPAPKVAPAPAPAAKKAGPK